MANFEQERTSERRLQYVDVTQAYLEQTTQAVHDSYGILKEFDCTATYKGFWQGKSDPVAHALAVNPNLYGAEVSFTVANPIFEGLLAAPPSSNTLRRPDTRMYLVRRGPRDCVLIKGVGRRFLTRDLSDVSLEFGTFYGDDDTRETERMKNYEQSKAKGWGSLGGVLGINVEAEFEHGYLLAELYKRVFHKNADIRLARKAHDITEAITAEGSRAMEPHYQLVYEIDTPVRSSYAEYFSDLGIFWQGLDLENPVDKEKALVMVNEVLCAYPLRYNTDLKILEIQDLQEIFQVLKEYESVIVGSESEQALTREASRKIGEMKFILARAGYALAEKFFEKNKEAAELTIEEEAKKLGSMVGMCMALGIQLGTAAHPKDSYGGTIADLDNIYFLDQEDVDREVAENINPQTPLACESICYVAAMLGASKEAQAKGVATLIKEATNAFKETLDRVQELGLSKEYMEFLHGYYEALSNNQPELITEDQWFALDFLIYGCGESSIYKYTGVEVPGVKVFKTPRLLLRPTLRRQDLKSFRIWDEQGEHDISERVLNQGMELKYVLGARVKFMNSDDSVEPIIEV